MNSVTCKNFVKLANFFNSENVDNFIKFENVFRFENVDKFSNWIRFGFKKLDSFVKLKNFGFGSCANFEKFGYSIELRTLEKFKNTVKFWNFTLSILSAGEIWVTS